MCMLLNPGAGPCGVRCVRVRRPGGVCVLVLLISISHTDTQLCTIAWRVQSPFSLLSIWFRSHGVDPRFRPSIRVRCALCLCFGVISNIVRRYDEIRRSVPSSFSITPYVDGTELFYVLECYFVSFGGKTLRRYTDATMLEPCLGHAWAMLGPCLGHAWAMLETCSSHARAILSHA